MSVLAIINWVIDLGILLEPLFKIGTLNMSFRRKVQASAVFLFSLFAVVAGLLRMILIIQGGSQGTAHPTTTLIGTTLPTVDVSGIVSLNLFWTYIEIGVGFLVACLPPCAQLVDRFSFSPITRTLHSFRSVLSLKKLNISDQREETRIGDLPRPWMISPKSSMGQHSGNSMDEMTTIGLA
ncbi:hypothetical protein N0V93_004492 [Gnomoniopsis smithogilvyi]|uniref:Rhodopsin domain-containing protein n=1 Tax=Gnomoniopsis smithogilvyi TaxID=1191159 RepID=A0A9W8YSY6_9PEZI|nr:hypothetical protein N0V93_004492 [Gnomoniopsis smithogilvyi]